MADKDSVVVPEILKPNSFVDGLIAQIAERALGNKVTTAVGVMVAVSGSIAAFTPVIPQQYQLLASTVSAFVGAIALIMSKDTSKKG
jgi:hypothetical protein